MGYLTPRDRHTLSTMLQRIPHGTRLELFMPANDPLSQEMASLLREVAEVSPARILLQTREVDQFPALAALYGVRLTPTLVLLDRFGDDTGMRIVGIPTGYQFGVLVQDMVDVALGRTRLSARSLAYLQNLDRDVEIVVAVAPTCPHSPRAARLAHHMAMANPSRVRAFVINAAQFPLWVRRFPVQGVPTTWITVNGEIAPPVEGVCPEDQLIQMIRTTRVGNRSERSLPRVDSGV
ncbi:MAG: glutaredoxin [Thermaerobacter sp.]|nr:glutaredoxin [Thermaerobacter sp.]